MLEHLAQGNMALWINCRIRANEKCVIYMTVSNHQANRSERDLEVREIFIIYTSHRANHKIFQQVKCLRLLTASKIVLNKG